MDMLQRGDTTASDWVEFLDAVLSDEDRLQQADVSKSELFIYEKLPWPVDMFHGQAKNGLQEVDTFCYEDAVDIGMALWNANRVKEMTKGCEDFFTLYDAGFFDEALQKGISVLTACSGDGVKYNTNLLSSLNEFVTHLLSIVLTTDMDASGVAEVKTLDGCE
jgi:hypothetical protein